MNPFKSTTITPKKPSPPNSKPVNQKQEPTVLPTPKTTAATTTTSTTKTDPTETNSNPRLSASTVAKNLRKLSVIVKDGGIGESIEDKKLTSPYSPSPVLSSLSVSKFKPSPSPSPSPTPLSSSSSTPISSSPVSSLPSSPSLKPTPTNSNGLQPILKKTIITNNSSSSSSNGSSGGNGVGASTLNLSQSHGELPSFKKQQISTSPINTPPNKPPPIPSKSNNNNTNTNLSSSTPSLPSLNNKNTSNNSSVSSSPSSSPISSSPITTFSSSLSSSTSSTGTLDKPIAKKPALPPRNELNASRGTIALPKLKPVKSNAQKYLNTMIQNSGGDANENDNDSSDEDSPQTTTTTTTTTPTPTTTTTTTTPTTKAPITNNGKTNPPQPNKSNLKPTTSNNTTTPTVTTTNSGRPLPKPKESPNTTTKNGTSTTSTSNSNTTTNTTKPVDSKSDKVQRNYLVQEILSTERKYVNSLSRIITIFMLPLKDKSETKEKIINLEDINNIFGNIETIFLLHKTFLIDLEARISKWTDQEKIGDVFVNFAPYLRSYVFYSNSYNTTMLTINNLQKSNPSFQQFLQKCLQKPSSKGLNLSAYLIMPIQRIPRYRLLLEQIIKFSEESHPDYKDLSLALVEISKVASQVDERILQYQISHRVLDIQNSLNGLTEDIVTPTRIFRKEGDLKKISDRVVNTRHFFLFNDLLIYSKKERKDTYRFKLSFPLATCWVKDLPDTPRFTNLFQIVSSKKNYFLSAPSLEEKLSWMQQLNEVINKVVTDNPECQAQRESIYEKRGSTTTKEILSELDKKSVNSTDADSEQDLRAQPLWLKDQMTKDCMLCGMTFTLTKRRHHCRKCMRIFCGQCCPIHDFSQYIPGKKIRVCKNCFEEVSVQLQVMSQNEEFENSTATTQTTSGGGTENDE